jgi:hypothetical protein
LQCVPFNGSHGGGPHGGASQPGAHGGPLPSGHGPHGGASHPPAHGGSLPSGQGPQSPSQPLPPLPLGVALASLLSEPLPAALKARTS